MKVPFSVMCILPANFDHVKNEPIESPVTVGDEYTVVHTQTVAEGLYYSLAGFDLDDGFDARLFATLPSTTDEVETEHQHEAIIYQR